MIINEEQSTKPTEASPKQSMSQPQHSISIRKKSSAISVKAKKMSNKCQRLLELKQKLQFVRERKAAIPTVPDPPIVQEFEEMKRVKERKMLVRKLQERIAFKKKEEEKLSKIYDKYLDQYIIKSEIFKEKFTLIKVLGNKMDLELTRTKERFREVEFNKIVEVGSKKLLYYRIAELFFNQNSRNIFAVFDKTKSYHKNDDEHTALAYGYLGLLMHLIGNLAGCRMWLDFKFRGSRSTLRGVDESLLTIHPKQPKIGECMILMSEQLHQLMRNYLGIKIDKNSTFVQLFEELVKEVLTTN